VLIEGVDTPGLVARNALIEKPKKSKSSKDDGAAPAVVVLLSLITLLCQTQVETCLQSSF
jgi:hypothetical protein